MMIEGILSIQAGDNPRIVEEKLKTFLDAGRAQALSRTTSGEPSAGWRGAASEQAANGAEEAARTSTPTSAGC